MVTEKTLRWISAFNFKIDMKLEDLDQYLADASGRKWFLGSKAFIGDYTSNLNQDTGTVIRVFKTDEGFAFDILNKAGVSEEEFQKELDDFMTLLKNKGATDFEPTENFY